MATASGTRPQRPPSTLPVFLLLVTGLGLLLATVMLVHYHVDQLSQRSNRESGERLGVAVARRALLADITAVTTDVMFLTRLIEELDFSPHGQSGQRDYLADLFIVFAREKRLYDQIRFLDVTGRERVRVNLGDGEPRAVPEPRLQDKSARYYVEQAQGLSKGQVYLSPLDLNVEDGTVELPYKPVLRFAMTVFDRQGNRRGLVILNYRGARLLDGFRHAASPIADHVQLLNDAGYWLSSPRPNEAWQFMFDDDTGFAQQSPAAWSQIRAREQGQFERAGQLVTFATVRPSVQAARAAQGGTIELPGAETWKIVSQLPLPGFWAGMGGFLGRYAGLYSGLSVLLAMLALFSARAEAHRRNAEARRAYERRFRRTLEDINLAAVMVDLDGRLTFCNHFLLDLTNWQRDEVIGTDWVSRFVPEGQRPRVAAVLDRLGRQNTYPPVFEGDIVTRDGSHRSIAWHTTPARDNAGEIIGLTAIGEDVTERRRAEEQVRKLSQAIEQSPTIVLITDRDARIEYVNPKFTEVTGYAPDEVVGRNPRLLKSGQTSRDEYCRLWAVLSQGGEWRGEFHNRRKDGSLYWESATISALRSPAGEITHFLAVKEDISENKRLQHEVDRRTRELARAQALATMGQMATMLAHDLRNPLSSAKMAIQMLAKRAPGNETTETAAIGLEQVRYMEEIIADMLTYARPGELRVEWLEADRLISGVLGTVRRRIDEYGAEVRVTCAPGLPTFPGDASKLRQLLSNLLVNALQAVAGRPAGSRHVSLTAGLATDHDCHAIRFTVCDNGSGIDTDVAERLFEPFFTTRTRGTGLGLAIVRQIADLHGTKVELAPNSPEGTCASIHLALARIPPRDQADDDDSIANRRPTDTEAQR